VPECDHTAVIAYLASSLDHPGQVVEQEIVDGCRQEPDIILELARLLLALVVRGVQHDQPMLEVDVPPPPGVTAGDG
jgi:hypothetical protein